MHRVKKYAIQHTDSTTSMSSQSSSSVLARELYNQVVKQVNKNLNKYERVLSSNPGFGGVLYHPRIGSMNLEVLEKQLDRLVDDDCLLEKELSRINFLQQRDSDLKEQETLHSMDPYKILKSAWTCERRSCQNSEQKVDEISSKVIRIKNHIKLMAGAENRGGANQELGFYVLQSKEYQDVIDSNRELVAKQEQYLGKIQMLETKILAMEETVRGLEGKLGSEGERIRKKEEELLRIMAKCQDLELQILHKQKLLKKTIKQKQTQNDPINSTKSWCFKNESSLIRITQTSQVCQQAFKTQKTLLQILSFLQTKSAALNLHSLTSGKLNISTFFNCPSNPINMNSMVISPRAACFSNSNNSMISSMSSFDSSSFRTDNVDTGISYVPEQVEMKRASRRKLGLERGETMNRSELYLGSQDKKKRFERTRLYE